MSDTTFKAAMTPKEYAELLEFVLKNNGWQDLYGRENLGKVPFIKYVTGHFDTRDGMVWSIIFQDGNGSKIFNHENLTKENIMNYLEGRKSKHHVEKM